MTPRAFYIQNPSIADFVESDEVVLKFFNEGGFFPHIIARLYEVVVQSVGNRYPLEIELKDVLTHAADLCVNSLETSKPVQTAKAILAHLEIDCRQREIQLIAGIAYALLYTNYDNGRPSFKLADYLDGQYCTYRYSLFHRGKTLLKKLQKGEITIEQKKPQPIDYSKPLTFEQEKAVLKMRQDTHTLYCVGDIVQTQCKCGEKVAVKITKIRNNGLSFTDDVQHARIAISSTKDMLDRVQNLLSSISNITTIPALEVMVGVVIMELDYLYVRLYADRALMDNGFFIALGNEDLAHDYGKHIEKLSSALSLWNRRCADKKDDACYFNPGFDYEQFDEHFVALLDSLTEKGNAVIDLLKEMDAAIKRPSTETIIKMYGLLHHIYMCSAYNKDLEDFETFHIGVTRANTIKLLTDRLSEMEKEVEESKVFEKFGYDLQTIICKLYNKSTNKWDEESLAKHIFAHRKDLSQDQLNVFFKYAEIGGQIKQELDEFRKTPDAVMVTPPSTPVPVAQMVRPTGPITAEELSEILRQYTAQGMPIVNLTVVNGENKIIQPENYGENVILGANGRIKCNHTDDNEEPAR